VAAALFASQIREANFEVLAFGEAVLLDAVVDPVGEPLADFEEGMQRATVDGQAGVPADTAGRDGDDVGVHGCGPRSDVRNRHHRYQTEG